VLEENALHRGAHGGRDDAARTTLTWTGDDPDPRGLDLLHFRISATPRWTRSSVLNSTR